MRSLHLVSSTMLTAAVIAQSPLAGAGKAWTLRELVSTWAGQGDSESRYEDAYVPWRNALLRSKDNGRSPWLTGEGSTKPLYPLQELAEALDAHVKRLPAIGPKSVPEPLADKVFAVAHDLRQQRDSVELLLPWLVLLQKNDPDDPRVAFCLFEAWGNSKLDAGAARQAEQRLQAILDGAKGPDAERAQQRMSGLLFEAAAMARGGMEPIPTLRRVVRNLCAEKIEAGQPLGDGALGRALLPEFELAYEAAVQAGDVAAVVSLLEAMATADPGDPAPELILALADRSRTCPRFEAAWRSNAAGTKSLDARLRFLGLGSIAPDTSVAAILEGLRDKGDDLGSLAAAFAFFRVDTERKLAESGTLLEKTEDELRLARENEVAAKEQLDVWSNKFESRKREQKAASEIGEAEQQVAFFQSRLDVLRADIKAKDGAVKSFRQQVTKLEGDVRTQKTRRSAFKLQR